ncbi:hypothetical protein, partial [Burkholderia pseudomallei]|uniref:hypothetical protein n=1 Tax=Burkholderia pseudomallei TaxID=28450 RepID=UPI001C4B9F70
SAAPHRVARRATVVRALMQSPNDMPDARGGLPLWRTLSHRAHSIRLRRSARDARRAAPPSPAQQRTKCRLPIARE